MGVERGAASAGVEPDTVSVKALTDSGYQVVDLLTKDQLERLRGVREGSGPAPGDPMDGLFNDTWSTDCEYKRLVSGLLMRILDAPVGHLLPEHRRLGFVHIVKWPGPAGAVVAHRDPSFVDEQQFRSLMLWCALDDVDDEQGALWVVPGSHRDPTGVRVHQSPRNVHPEIDAAFRELAVPLEIKAGQAIVYDHALIHRSGPNNSALARVAVSGVLIPNAARPRYAIPVRPEFAEIIEIDERFFVEHRLCALDIDAVLSEYATVGAVGV